MKIDVIIVTWNSGERVLACLERLEESGQAPHRTIVIDNASGDDTVENVTRRFANVETVQLGRNVGFGAAVNVAVDRGDGEAIVLVNDDVEVAPGCLEALTSPLREDPRCGMVAGLTTMPGDGLVDGFGIELDVTLAAYNRARGAPVGALESRAGVLAAPSGGLAAYRRAAFEAVGGFDERLFAYGEDVDLGLRLTLDGWRAGAARDARGVHLGGASVGVDSPLQRRLAGFARGFVLRRYGVLTTRHAVRALAFEALVVGWGLLAHRTAVPLRGRLEGWRAGAGPRLRAPAGSIDRSIGAREALRRLRGPR